MRKETWVAAAAGTAAGAVNGFFGAGGGMVLVPILEHHRQLREDQLFPAAMRIMLPVCLISLFMTPGPLPWAHSLPYVTGSLLGGLLSLGLGKRIPVQWLHRSLGLLILWGGIRLLWT